MNVRNTSQLISIRAGLILTIGLLAMLVYQVVATVGGLDALFRSRRALAACGIPVFGLLAAIAALAATWTRHWPAMTRLPEELVRVLARLRCVNLLGFGLVIGTYAFLILGPLGGHLKSLPIRAALLWNALWIGAVFLKAFAPVRAWRELLPASVLLIGVGYLAAGTLQQVSTFPFALDWSETSRYYYASLFFAERIYGMAVPLPVLHPSRYLMQSVPFLIPGLPLWVHRLWQALLWLALPLITVTILGKRLFRSSRPASAMQLIYRRLFLAWAFLFLFQGPVYYHLLVPTAFILGGYAPGGAIFSRRFWQSLFVVLAASAWAGISRINWFPVPGILAAVLFFLETPLEPPQPTFSAATTESGLLRRSAYYLLPPAVWIIGGTVTAFAAQTVYIRWSGVDPQVFASSFSSDLLWYRLLPSQTYPLGILLAIGLAAGPLVLITLLRLRGLHPVRIIGIVAAWLVLFAGGLVVSVKIGGGSNLHNLDAFLVVVLVAGSFAVLGKIEPDSAGVPPFPPLKPGLVALAILLPVLFAITSGRSLTLPDRSKTDKTLLELQDKIDSTVQQGGRILLISQRHLLTFGMLPGVTLEPDYENVFLMEMAMGNNRAYLANFYADLGVQRYALIVSDPINVVLKGSDSTFGEENDIWVERVARPLLEHYQEIERFKRLGIEVLAPKPTP